MTDRFEQILSAYEKSHMPYIANTSKGTILCFCLPLNNVWKIHVSIDGGAVAKLGTATAPGAVECSPVVHETSEGIFVSFISDSDWRTSSLALKKCKIGSAGSVEIHPSAKCGYTSPEDGTAYVNDSVILESTCMPDMWIKNVRRIACVRPCSKGLLVSYKTQDDIGGTILMQYDDKKVFELRTEDDRPLYKPCEYNDVFFNVLKTGDRDDDRRIEICRRVNMYEDAWNSRIGTAEEYNEYRRMLRAQCYQ